MFVKAYTRNLLLKFTRNPTTLIIYFRQRLSEPHKKAECLRAFQELMAEGSTSKMLQAFINGPSAMMIANGDRPDLRHNDVLEILAIRKVVGKKLKLKPEEYPKLESKGVNYDALFLRAKEGNPPRCPDVCGVEGKHILCFDISTDGGLLVSGSSLPKGEILIWVSSSQTVSYLTSFVAYMDN